MSSKIILSVFDDEFDEDQLLEIAKKSGYIAPKVECEHDVWDVYLRLLSSLSKEMGNDVIAFVENKALKEIENLECTECPVYKMELNRNRSRNMEERC